LDLFNLACCNKPLTSRKETLNLLAIHQKKKKTPHPKNQNTQKNQTKKNQTRQNPKVQPF